MSLHYYNRQQDNAVLPFLIVGKQLKSVNDRPNKRKEEGVEKMLRA